MNKFAFAAVAALALTAATSAFADDQLVNVGHGAAVVVHADQASAPAGNLAGDYETVNYGGPGTVELLAGPAVVSKGATELVRSGDTVTNQTVVSVGLGRYIIG